MKKMHEVIRLRCLRFNLNNKYSRYIHWKPSEYGNKEHVKDLLIRIKFLESIYIELINPIWPTDDLPVINYQIDRGFLDLVDRYNYTKRQCLEMNKNPDNMKYLN